MAIATHEFFIKQEPLDNPPTDLGAYGEAPPSPAEEDFARHTEAYAQSQFVLHELIAQYPEDTPEQWDRDAVTARIWLEKNSQLIGESLRQKLLDTPYSRGDLEQQIQLLHETIESVTVIRQAHAGFSERQDKPESVDLPTRIALNRARLELVHTIARVGGRPIVANQDNYVSWTEVDSTLTGCGLDPSRGAIDARQDAAIHAVYEMYQSGVIQRYITYRPDNQEFRQWVAQNHPNDMTLIDQKFVELYTKWYQSKDWTNRRAELEAPLTRACEELGVDFSVRVNPLQTSKELTAALRSDLNSEDLPFDTMREPLQTADSTTEELLRQIKASGRYQLPCDALVQAKLHHANSATIDIIAGLLHLQQEGALELGNTTLAQIIDAHARTAAFMYVNGVRPLPPCDRRDELTYATQYNEALKSFMIADGLVLAAKKADQLAA